MRRYAGRSITVSPSTPGLPLFSRTRFSARVRFIALTIRSIRRGSWSPERSSPCLADSASSLRRSIGAAPSSPAGAPSGRWTSGAWPSRDSRSIRSPLRSALCVGAVQTTRSPTLLRPLLTSRSAASNSPAQRSPFRDEARSPQVTLLDCPCTSAGFTWLPLDRESFAANCPLALVGPACYPVFVRHPAGLATPLLSAIRSRSSPCGSLGSLRSTPQRTYTSWSRAMLGTQQNARAARSQKSLDSFSVR